MAKKPCDTFCGLVRLLALAIVLGLVTCGLIAAHALWVTSRSGMPGPVSAIVVLGGGVRADGTPGPDSLRRAQAGIDLYHAGVAPHIHFTGGHGNTNILGLGEAMAQVAVSQGVPAQAISTESRSRSTLQNAMFSASVLPPETTGSIILVSDGYHLARAQVSFRWAGYHPVSVFGASGFGQGSIAVRLRRVVREAFAWWFNAVRMIIWSLLSLTGTPFDPSGDFLAQPNSPDSRRPVA